MYVPHLLSVTIRHWLPIITFCPVNHLPDLIYVSVTFRPMTDEEIPELYEVRRKLKKFLRWRKIYMEDVARMTMALFPECTRIDVRLAFNRHLVTYHNHLNV